MLNFAATHNPAAALRAVTASARRAAVPGVLLILALVALSLPVRAADTLPGDIPEVSSADIYQALTLAGSNRGELEAALDHCRQMPYTMAAMRFVVASLPLADLGVITTDELVEHVEMAIQARAEAPYGLHYTDAVWAHYVLPPRVSQEPLSRWRPYFHRELAPLVADCETLQDAAIIVDAWVSERTAFKQTQRRDQGPLVTLKSGFGRCEELMMVQVCAMRSVGIPARNAFCPWWAHCDNNHAWTEVYCSDGAWHMADSGAIVGFSGTSWVTPTAKGAPIVCSMCFGLPGEGEAGELVNSRGSVGARYAMLNSIDAYRTTARLNIDFNNCLDAADPPPALDADGEEIEYKVYVHVFNYGALRSVARLPVGTDWTASVELGAGRFVLTTNIPGVEREVYVDLVPGESVDLDWDAAEVPGGEFVLEFPKSG